MVRFTANGRYVHVVNQYGELVNKVFVPTFMYAAAQGMKYKKDWRNAYNLRILESGDKVACDDGYVVTVVKISYGSTINKITTEVNSIVELPPGQPPLDLEGCFLTTNPQILGGYFIAPPMMPAKRLLEYTKIAQAFLNTLDLEKAYRSVRPGRTTKADIERILYKDEFRYILMAHILDYFHKSGVTPDAVLALVHERMADEAPVDTLLSYLELYAKIHPDMHVDGVPRDGLQQITAVARPVGYIEDTRYIDAHIEGTALEEASSSDEEISQLQENEIITKEDSDSVYSMQFDEINSASENEELPLNKPVKET